MKKAYGWAGLGVLLTAWSLQSGCGTAGPFGLTSGSNGSAGEPTGLAAQIAAKALTVGGCIGGSDGFGGALMDGYLSHMMGHMISSTETPIRAESGHRIAGMGLRRPPEGCGSLVRGYIGHPSQTI